MNKYLDMIEKRASDLSPSTIKRIEKIKTSGNNHNLFELSYMDKKGIRTKRIVEPYKITDTDFWGYDVSKSSIRRFKINGIKGVKLSKKTFEPRWETQMN